MAPLWEGHTLVSIQISSPAFRREEYGRGRYFYYQGGDSLFMKYHSILILALLLLLLCSGVQGRPAGHDYSHKEKGLTGTPVILVSPGDSLQAAVNAVADGGLVVLKKGTWYEKVRINKSVTIIGSGPQRTIISGDIDDHGVDASVINLSRNGLASDTFVSLMGLTITKGTANYGGGIFNGKCTLILTEVNVTGNSALFSGGGIYNEYGTVTLYGRTSVTGNTAKVGGGIVNDNGVVTMNHLSSVGGNTAQLAGGIENIGGKCTLFDKSAITGNVATMNGGGGVYNWFSSTITMNGGSITKNTATSPGGGIYSDDTSSVIRNGGTIANNSPDDLYPPA